MSEQAILKAMFRAVVEVPESVLEDDEIDPDDYIRHGDLLEYQPAEPWMVWESGMGIRESSNDSKDGP